VSHLFHFLGPAVGNGSPWKLCYRASLHGWDAFTFHSLCDGKKNTVTVIESNHYVFGGYTDVPWGSTTNHGGYRYTDKAFIYSLRNEEGIRPIKGMVKDPPQAIYVNPSYGPTFGGGHDIYIADNANGNGNSYTRIGISYDAPTGVKEQITIVRFTPDEVEVFYLL